MTTPRDLTPFLDGLPLDFVALGDARTFARNLPTGEDVHAQGFISMKSQQEEAGR